MYLKDMILKATTHINICKGNPEKNADSTYNLRIPLTICGFHLRFRIPQQLNLTIQMFYRLFVDSTHCSGFRKYSCGFGKFAYFERYNDLAICLWNSIETA